MRLFKQLERCKVVALNKKIHLSTIINEQVFVFCQNRRMRIKYFIDFFSVFLKNKSIFLSIYILFQIGKVRE